MGTIETPPKEESLGQTIETWKQTVEVQQHFNDLQLRLRSFMITLLVGVLGAAGFAIKYRASVDLGGVSLAVSGVAVLAGMLALLAFYFMDFGYHRLLIGAVNHAIKIEDAVGAQLPGIELVKSIKEASNFRLLGITITSTRRLHSLYGGLLLALLAIGLFGQLALSSTASNEVVSAAPPESDAGSAVATGERCGTPALRAYYSSGAYIRAVELAAHTAMGVISAYQLGTLESTAALVLDIDETALSTWPILDQGGFCWKSERFEAFVGAAEAPALEPIRLLYEHARSQGLGVYFITSRSESLREETRRNLAAAGYVEFRELIMRPKGPRSKDFKMQARRRITESGMRILVNIGDQLGDLAGGFAEHEVLVPNPFYTTGI